jgi:hypothetical protein
MKKLFLISLCITSLTAAQPQQIKTLFELKSSVKLIQLKNDFKILTSEQSLEKKSGFLAVVYSLLLPGMGELYAGNYDRGKYFTIADALCWGAYAGYNIYGSWQRNNYKTYAVTYGGIELSGKDAGYFANISEYTSIDDYNRNQGLNGDFDLMYNTQKYYWNWGNVTQRTEYRNMWESSEQAFNNVRFAVGALIINRIISAIDAALIVRSHNKKIMEQTSWNVSLGINKNYPSGLEINFLKSF